MKKIYRTLSLAAILTALLYISGSAQNAWINEIHYNDFGTDTNEFIEVVIQSPGNYTLSSFAVVLYNGNNGASYNTKTLDLFTAGGTFEGYGVYYYMYPVNGIQNGEPDGMALTFNDAVIPGQFLSYEGVLMATDGPASGMTSVDIGVMEAGELEGFSLQLSGQGNEYPDFTWQPPADETHGGLNNAQDLLPVGIGEQKALIFSLFPNPNQGQFQVSNASGKTMIMHVYHATGILAGEFIINPGLQNISLEGVSKGIYMARFSDINGKIPGSERFVIY